MKYRIEQKIEELLAGNPDPREPAGVVGFRERKYREGCPPTYGIVVDNKDPECLGRLRLSLPLVGPDAVTPWYQVAGNRKAGNGLWALPEIGTQVVVCFPYGDRSHGIILGCIYDQKHRPPQHDTENPSASQLIQTKNHRIEIINEDGKEEIRVETAKGQMRAILSKKGIELINGLDGGIELSGKKISLKGKNVSIAAEKSLSINSDGPAGFKEKGKFTLASDKDVTLKGKSIKMSGSKGVTAEGKQMAVEGDKVVGMDTHIMVVPSGNGTTTVPLPHPFIGKLADKLSKDVKIKDKPCATKDSVAKHDDSMHMQLPGTIKFQNNPKKEGKVSGGTSSKVKVNGKEAAVIGSQVSTCNDVGAQNNSTVIAMGASIPMPVIINPENTEEWEREQEEKERKEPKFSSVKWATTSCEEGEEAELTASVQDIADGNMVTLQVFPEGKGPEDSIPVIRFPLTVKGGSVSAKWSYRGNQNEMPPESNPRFVFSAHCAWCSFEKSSNTLEVKLKRPEIKKAEWHNSDNQTVTKEKMDNLITLYAQTKDIDDGKSVVFEIFDSTQDPDADRPLKTLDAYVESNKAETEFDFNDLMPPPKIDEALYRYYAEKGEDIPREQFEFLLEDYEDEVESPYKEKPKFFFIAKAQKCRDCSSEDVELSKDITVSVLDAAGNGEKDAEVSLKEPDGTEHKVTCGEDGIATFEDLIPGNYNVKIERKRK